jgi:hypothetical protein
MVAKQLHRRPMVPRPRGSGVQPTMSVVEFIDVVNSRVLLGVFLARLRGIRQIHIYLHGEAETQPACKDELLALSCICGFRPLHEQPIMSPSPEDLAAPPRCSRKSLRQCEVICCKTRGEARQGRHGVHCNRTQRGGGCMIERDLVRCQSIECSGEVEGAHERDTLAASFTGSRDVDRASAATRLLSAAGSGCHT